MKNKKLILTFILFGIVGFVVGKTIFNSFKTDNDYTVKIESILNNYCDCESIEKSIYAKGVQYSNSHGFTTEKVKYTLTKCKYESVKAEGEKIAKLLINEGLETFNLIILEFVSDKKQEIISINKGKIQSL